MQILNVIEDPHTDVDLSTDTPKTLEEAKASPDWSRWELSYHEELISLEEMGVWELII